MSLLPREGPAGTFILPVYNAAGFLSGTLRQVHRWLAARPEAWELIVVDDASTDGTAAILDDFVARHGAEAVRRVRFSANRGKGFATRVGMGLARGRFTVFTDCDLAYPVENAERILAALEEGAGAAIACRVLPRSTYLISPSFFSYLYTRHLMGRFFNVLCRLLTVPRLLDTQAGLKGFRTEAVRPLIGRLVMDGFSFDVELLRGLLDRGVRVAEVPVSFRYDSEPSTVRFIIDSARMIHDLLRIRWRSLRGRYAAGEDGAGEPAGLVVHADDFGLAPGISRAIEESLESGAVTSASILLGGPHCAAALAWAAAHPRFDFGVHLNLTQGRPVLPAARVPSLVTPAGEFPPLGRFLARFFTGRIRLEEVRHEWRAQLEAVRRAGVAVTHLDSHQHVHLLPRLFQGAMAPLARQESLAVRAMDGPVRGGGPWPDPKGLVLALATRRSLRAEVRPPAAAHGFGTAFMRRPTLERFRALLSRTRRGRTYELVVHPGRVDAELIASGDAYVEGREMEERLIASEEFRAVVRHAGLELRDLGSAEAPSIARADS